MFAFRFGVITTLLTVTLCLLASAGLSGCEDSGQTKAERSGRTTVVVSIPPLAGLVGPLLDPDTEIRVLVPNGRSAHGYRPTAEDIAAIGRAEAVFMVGMNLETGMARSVRGAPVITMADVLGIEGDPHAGHGHSGDDHTACAHGTDDPHLWLDPVLAAEFVRALPGHLPATLMTADTENESRRLAESIEAVDAEYTQRLAPYAGRSIVTHHASFNRPAERYGLKVAAVLRAVETLEPSPADIANAVEAIQSRRVGAIFVEPQFGATSATRVADAAGVQLVTLDPLGTGDWIGLMRTNLDALIEGLTAGGTSDDPESTPTDP